MRKYWWLGFLMVAVLLVLSGCGTTPSGGGGVVLEVRVLSKTSYQALLRITLTNYSSVNFYFTRAEAKSASEGGLA